MVGYRRSVESNFKVAEFTFYQKRRRCCSIGIRIIDCMNERLV